MAKQILASGVLTVMIVAQGCGGARPYTAMYKSASSELSATAQARDHRLKMNLRAALVGEQGFAGLSLSPEVYMERGYVTGHVDTSEQAEAVLHVARGVPGLRSIDSYLPVARAKTGDESNLVSDVTIEAEVASALRLAPGIVASRINVTVLDGQVVLLTHLRTGQRATVLQLPAQPRTPAEVEAQTRVAFIG